MNWTDVASWVAVYAAIVSTGALALEVRRWTESGPRLSLTVMPEARTYGGLQPDDNDHLVARVTNRGQTATTVTNFGLHEYRSIFHRWGRRASRSAIVHRPEFGHPLPYLLQPGTEWMGSATYDDELRAWAESGRLFLAIYHSHSSRPIQRRVMLPAKAVLTEQDGSTTPNA